MIYKVNVMRNESNEIVLHFVTMMFNIIFNEIDKNDIDVIKMYFLI